MKGQLVTQQLDPLSVIANAARQRAVAEKALTRWIPIAYQRGESIYQIAKAADITRAAVYHRLWGAGVKTKGQGPSELFEPAAVPAAEQQDVADAPKSAKQQDVARSNGHHPFEQAWSEAGEPLMVCQRCNQWHDAPVHHG